MQMYASYLRKGARRVCTHTSSAAFVWSYRTCLIVTPLLLYPDFINATEGFAAIKVFLLFVKDVRSSYR